MKTKKEIFNDIDFSSDWAGEQIDTAILTVLIDIRDILNLLVQGYLKEMEDENA